MKRERVRPGLSGGSIFSEAAKGAGTHLLNAAAKDNNILRVDRGTWGVAARSSGIGLNGKDLNVD